MAGFHSSHSSSPPLQIAAASASAPSTTEIRDTDGSDRHRQRARSLGRAVGLHLNESTVQVACLGRRGPEPIRTRPARVAQVSQEAADGTQWAERGFRYAGHRLFVGHEASRVAAAGLPTGRSMGCGRMELHISAAEFALNRMLETYPGPALRPGEICVLSIPGPPIGDARDFSFHQLILEDVIRKLGYRPAPLEDSRAVALAEPDADSTSLFALSVGETRVDGSLSHRGIAGPCFSIEPGGRWIDGRVANALGIDEIAAGQIRKACQNVQLPRCREDQAVSTYCRRFVDRLMQRVVEYADSEGTPFGRHLGADGVVLVLAGSWRWPGGFGELVVQAAAQQELPFELCAVRTPAAPEEAIVRGCLKAALTLGTTGHPDAYAEYRI